MKISFLSRFDARSLTVLDLGGVGYEGGQLHLLLPGGLVKAVRVAASCVPADRISEGQGRGRYGSAAVQIAQVIRREVL